MRKAKKYFAEQKIKDGRLQAARQMMHDDSHDIEQSYDEDEYRQGRFAGGRISSNLDGDNNDTYQDLEEDDVDVDVDDNLESRAEYNSEDDEDIDVNFRSKEPRSNQIGGAHTYDPSLRGSMSSNKFRGRGEANSISGSGLAEQNDLKKKKTLTQKFFGGVNKYLKN